MPKAISVYIEIKFKQDGSVMYETEHNGVPKSLIFAELKRICEGLANKIIDDAKIDADIDFMSAENDEQIKEYLDAIIATDKLKLEQMLKE